MGNEVYVNTRDISCKDAEGKSICAFPDVCLSPPSPPAGPVPIPYPNTGMASDTTSGSKTVMVSGQEVMLKDKSFFKQSTGDEAATKSLGMGVVTHQIQGKVYFTSWSMDVLIEGENAVRHLDLTTHNHASGPPNTAPWTYLDRMAMAKGIKECDAAREDVKTKCGDTKKKAKCPSAKAVKSAEKARYRAKKKYGEDSPVYKRYDTIVNQEYDKLAQEVEKDECQKALRCFMSPYKPSRCCPGQTPHHVVDAASFLEEAPGLARDDPNRPKKTGWKKYNVNKAPCVCVEGPNQTTATHGAMHTRTGVQATAKMDAKGQWSRTEATDAGVKSVTKTFPNTESCKECMKKQLDKYHDIAKTTPDDRPIDASTEMTADPAARATAAAEMGVPPPGFTG